MEIDGAGADGAAAGDGDARESHAGHQRAEDERGGAHGFDQLVAGFRIGAETGGADGGAVLGASVAEFDFGAHGGQQAALGFDVAHLGNVFEDDGFGGEQSGSHGRQRGVFSAADADGAEQRIASANDKLVHEISPGRIRNEYEWRTTILHAPGMRCCDVAAGSSAGQVSSSSEPHEGADDGVMQRRTELLDGLIGGIGPGAVGEQGDGELAFGIAPERGSGVAEMPEGARGKQRAGLGWRDGVSQPRVREVPAGVG